MTFIPKSTNNKGRKAMLHGRCLKCGITCHGWALRSPRYQTCDKCGAGLEITDDSGMIFKGYSPFAAEEYIINHSTDPLPNAKEKDSPT